MHNYYTHYFNKKIKDLQKNCKDVELTSEAQSKLCHDIIFQNNALKDQILQEILQRIKPAAVINLQQTIQNYTQDLLDIKFDKSLREKQHDEAITYFNRLGCKKFLYQFQQRGYSHDTLATLTVKHTSDDLLGPTWLQIRNLFRRIFFFVVDLTATWYIKPFIALLGVVDEKAFIGQNTLSFAQLLLHNNPISDKSKGKSISENTGPNKAAISYSK
jgi:hypothetical protein